MSNSPLVDFTRISPNKTVPRNSKIERITIHCLEGLLTPEGIGEWFDNPSLDASSNYGIGVDGRVGMFVEEKDRSWCSSNRDNDHRAITIECASEKYGERYVEPIVFDKLLDLIEDICRRNDKTKVLWISKKEDALKYKPLAHQVVLTLHKWFDATKVCPGDYLCSRMGEIADTVTNRLAEPTYPDMEWYRVRESWNKPSTQKAADKVFANAKKDCIKAGPKYKVYDNKGHVLYPAKVERNPVLEWQKAAIADGFKFPEYGADGKWGAECEGVAIKAVVKKRLIGYKYPNLTGIVQEAVGAEVDGKCGKDTDTAIREYQKAHGLTVDGCVGLNTWKKILGV